MRRHEANRRWKVDASTTEEDLKCRIRCARYLIVQKEGGLALLIIVSVKT